MISEPKPRQPIGQDCGQQKGRPFAAEIFQRQRGIGIGQKSQDADRQVECQSRRSKPHC